MAFYICVKFYEIITNGFQSTVWTRVYVRNHYLLCSFGQQPRKPELWFVCSGRFLMVFHMSVKFHENI